MYVQILVEKSLSWIPEQCVAVIYQTLMLCFGPIWTYNNWNTGAHTAGTYKLLIYMYTIGVKRTYMHLTSANLHSL